MNRLRSIWALAHSVLLEAVRRKDIYLLVALCLALIGITLSLDFFGVVGLVKFYREISLGLMGMFTALAVMLLAVRQLPREFKDRTIYPLLARPVSRWTFLVGKAAGVMLAACFCYGLFMAVFIPGIYHVGGDLAWGLFLQHLYLQFLQMLLLTAASFLLSLLCSADAALTLTFLLYFASELISHISLTLHELSNATGRVLLHGLNYALPQLALFDLSGKALHSEIWRPLPMSVMGELTVYAAIYITLFGVGAHALFRRRPL